MKFFAKFLAAFALLLAASSAVANSSITNVTITNIEGDVNGYFYIYFATNNTGAPTCAAVHNVYAINGASAAGAVQMMVATQACMDGIAVSVQGTGSCLVPEFEGVNWIYTTGTP